jgi:hypothetical protein
VSITRRPFETRDGVEGYIEDDSRNADAPDVRGVYLQSDTSNDADVLVTRDNSDNLTFQDVPNPTPTTLSDLLSRITPAQHAALRQLIHLADGVGGPMEDWASGSYRETLPANSPFPTSVIWYTDNTKTFKIIEKLITFDGQYRVTQVLWAVYASDGVTVIAYSGTLPFELNRTRTVV